MVVKFKLFDFIKNKINSKLEQHSNLKKILINMGWLSFDRLFQLFISFVVVIWVIRYLGPEQFGLLSYSWAFTGLFSAFTFSCIGNILLRDLIKFEDRRNELLGTSFVILLSAGVVCFLLSILTAFLLNPSDWFLVLLVGISAFSFIINGFSIIDYWFQSKVQSKYVVLSRNIMLVLVSLIKISLILLNSPLIYFAIVSLLEVLFFSIGLIYFYSKKNESIFNWRFKFKLALSLIKESWPLIFSGLAMSIYMRIDQVMLGQMLDMSSVGVYSVAVKLTEFANFIPGILISSLLPAIVLAQTKNKDLYLSRFRKLYGVLFIISIGFTLILALFSPQIIVLLYGEEYIGASPVLFIYAWSMIPLFLSIALAQYFVIEKKIKFSFYTTVIGAGLNILLNLLLIPHFGVIGAAIATVVSYSISVLSVLLFKETREHGVLMLKSLNLFKILKEFVFQLK